MKAKKPSQIDLLRAEIKALREEVAALKAAPPVVNHNHYHFGDGGMGQPAPLPMTPLHPWPGYPYRAWPDPTTPHWPTVTCVGPLRAHYHGGGDKHTVSASGPTIHGVIFTGSDHEQA